MKADQIIKTLTEIVDSSKKLFIIGDNGEWKFSMAHTNTENALNSRTKTIVIFDNLNVPSQSFFGQKIDLTNVNNLSTIDCLIPKSKYKNLHVVYYTSQNISVQ